MVWASTLLMAAPPKHLYTDATLPETFSFRYNLISWPLTTLDLLKLRRWLIHQLSVSSCPSLCKSILCLNQLPLTTSSIAIQYLCNHSKEDNVYFLAHPLFRLFKPSSLSVICFCVQISNMTKQRIFCCGVLVRSLHLTSVPFHVFMFFFIFYFFTFSFSSCVSSPFFSSSCLTVLPETKEEISLEFNCASSPLSNPTYIMKYKHLDKICLTTDHQCPDNQPTMYII